MSNTSGNLSRGKLAKQSGVNGETIRYYEKIGLMPEPGRSDAGYRIYDETHQKRLLFIKRSRELGFTLKEIAQLLGLVDGGEYTCAEIRDYTIVHLKSVEDKIRDLQKCNKHSIKWCLSVMETRYRNARS